MGGIWMRWRDNLVRQEIGRNPSNDEKEHFKGYGPGRRGTSGIRRSTECSVRRRVSDGYFVFKSRLEAIRVSKHRTFASRCDDDEVGGDVWIAGLPAGTARNELPDAGAAPFKLSPERAPTIASGPDINVAASDGSLERCLEFINFGRLLSGMVMEKRGSRTINMTDGEMFREVLGRRFDNQVDQLQHHRRVWIRS
jgi:hypothetical protein